MHLHLAQFAIFDREIDGDQFADLVTGSGPGGGGSGGRSAPGSVARRSSKKVLTTSERISMMRGSSSLMSLGSMPCFCLNMSQNGFS